MPNTGLTDHGFKSPSVYSMEWGPFTPQNILAVVCSCCGGLEQPFHSVQLSCSVLLVVEVTKQFLAMSCFFIWSWYCYWKFLFSHFDKYLEIINLKLVCVCVCVCVCLCMYVYSYMCATMRVYQCVYALECVWVCARVRVCVFVRARRIRFPLACY